MIARLHQHKVDLVCLAGYMRIISPASSRLPQPHSERPSVIAARISGLDGQKQAFDYAPKSRLQRPLRR